MTREIVLDTETTGLSPEGGHRLVSVAAVELVNGKPTGREVSLLLNPGRPIPPETTKIHGISDAMVQDKPVFADVAKQLKDFIGDAPIVITCRTEAGKTLDIEFLNAEMKQAGAEPFKPAQWVNVRRWSEEMFGAAEARLDRVLDRYGIDRSVRDREGHSALLDAQLLAAVYPRLKADYARFKRRARPRPPRL